MGVPKRVLNFLEKSKVKFEIIKHKKVFTAFDKSQTLKVPPKIIGKTLILKVDKKFVLVLISADQKLDFKKLKKFGKKIELAKESQIKKKLKGVKIGAIPPFGNLWKIPTIADISLKKQKEIILNSGDWFYSIKISPRDLEKLIGDLVWAKIASKK